MFPCIFLFVFIRDSLEFSTSTHVVVVVVSTEELDLNPEGG